MFAKDVVQSDAFVDMPLSAQALYFHLGMEADDEGFLANAQRIMRSILANKDDMSVLIAKGFVVPFDNGVCVIRHWKINNLIRPDRFKPTIYQAEKALISGEISALDTVGIPDDYQTATNGKPRLGKGNVVYTPLYPPLGGADEPKKKKAKKAVTPSAGFDEFWAVYPRKQNRQAALKAWDKLAPDEALRGKISQAVKAACASPDWTKDGGQFIPYPSSYLNQRRWEDEGTTLPSQPSQLKAEYYAGCNLEVL